MEPFPTRPLPLDQVDEPADPVRTSFDDQEFFGLIDSMRKVGQLQPIIVRPRGPRFECVAGHRRLKAAKYLRWVTIQATIQTGTDEQALTSKAHENAFREAIQPEDEGKFFEGLAANLKLGVREIASMMNRSPYYVESRLKVRTWPEDVRDALRNGILGIGAAEAFAEISDIEERRRLLAYGIASGINAKTARSWADAWAISHSQIDPAVIQAQQQHIVQQWQEPLYPCYGCESPVPVGRLKVIRLCERCSHDLDTATRGPYPDRRDDPGAGETRAQTPPPSTVPPPPA